MSVVFECEGHPLIVQYFDHWAPRGTTPRPHNQSWRDLTEFAVANGTYDPELWQKRLEQEAKLQEWYHVVDGTKKLLVPTIRVES